MWAMTPTFLILLTGSLPAESTLTHPALTISHRLELSNALLSLRSLLLEEPSDSVLGFNSDTILLQTPRGLQTLLPHNFIALAHVCWRTRDNKVGVRVMNVRSYYELVCSHVMEASLHFILSLNLGAGPIKHPTREIKEMM